MELEKFKNIGDIKVNVYKSFNNDYSFYLQPSNNEVLHIVDILDDTLKQYQTKKQYLLF